MFGQLLALIGCVTMSLLAFILPGLFYIVQSYRGVAFDPTLKPKFDVVGAWVAVLIGLCGMTLGGYVSILNFIDYFKGTSGSGPQCAF